MGGKRQKKSPDKLARGEPKWILWIPSLDRKDIDKLRKWTFKEHIQWRSVLQYPAGINQILAKIQRQFRCRAQLSRCPFPWIGRKEDTGMRQMCFFTSLRLQYLCR